MNLDDLNGYGVDELRGAFEQIFDVLMDKQYDRGVAKGQDAPLVWRNKLIPFTTIDGKDYVSLDWLMDELKATPPNSSQESHSKGGRG